MPAYYNENDQFAVAWLRELIKEGLIADGEVDDRSIELVRPADLRGFAQCHFFAGIGGWSYALRLADWDDSRPVWTGSCPCQPWSAVNTSRAGEGDARDLWPTWFLLIRECAPQHVFGEQVANGDGLRWFDRTRSCLEASGYACGAVDLVGTLVGTMQEGARLFFVAEAASQRRGGRPASIRRKARCDATRSGTRLERVECSDGRTRLIESGIKPLAHGLPARVGRLRGYGNAIVPQVAAVFIQAYCDTRFSSSPDAES